LNGLECPGQEFLEFSAEDVGNEKTYHLNIKLLQHSSRWISGAGILFRHPLDCHFGTWILEMKIITRDHGMGIGVFDLTKVKKGKYALHMDVEKSDGWCGYYNGGETVNVCANGKRLHSNIFKNNENMQASHMWSSGEMVGVCVDFDQRKLVPVHRISNQKKEEEKKKEDGKGNTYTNKENQNNSPNELEFLTAYEVALPEKNIALGWHVWFHKIQDSVEICPPRRIR